MTEPTPQAPSPGIAAVAAILQRAIDAQPGDGPVSLTDELAAPPPDDEPDGEAGPRANGFDVDAMNQEWGLVLMGSKAVIVREQARGPIEDRLRILSIEAFGHWFANTFTEVRGPDGKIKGTTYAARWIKHKKRRAFAGIEFFPTATGEAGTTGYLNLWRGFSVTPRPGGSYAIFADHLLNNVCEGDPELYRWVFGWFAHLMQRPRERVGTALVMRGKMGTGKTKVGEVMGSLIGAHYFAVDDPRYVTGNFNAHMASCLLLQAEEAVWAGDKAAEGRLKGLITSKFQMIENKGIDPIRLDNYVRLLMTSNEDWVIPAGKDERRFCVLDVNPRCAQNIEYFREMDQELADGGREALLHDLLHFDLSDVELRKIPRTKALLEQKIRSLDTVESWWFERLVSGNATVAGSEWPAEPIAVNAMFEDYILQADKVGVRRKSEQVAFGMKLAKLVPRLMRSKRQVDDQPGIVKRVWCYQLPPLAVCRAAWVQEVGQDVDWGDGSPVDAPEA